MIITVDSNILFSIFTRDSLYDQAALWVEKYSSHTYIINNSIYLELAVYFDALERLDQVLETLEITLLTQEEKRTTTLS